MIELLDKTDEKSVDLMVVNKNSGKEEQMVWTHIFHKLPELFCIVWRGFILIEDLHAVMEKFKEGGEKKLFTYQYFLTKPSEVKYFHDKEFFPNPEEPKLSRIKTANYSMSESSAIKCVVSRGTSDNTAYPHEISITLRKNMVQENLIFIAGVMHKSLMPVTCTPDVNDVYRWLRLLQRKSIKASAKLIQ